MRRLYIDEDISKNSGRVLSEIGHDVILTEEAGNKGRTDVQQLVFAISEHRLLITSNRDDFSKLHEAWLTAARLWGISGSLHHGILIVAIGREIDPHPLAQAIDRFLTSTTETVNRLYRMDRFGNYNEVGIGVTVA